MCPFAAPDGHDAPGLIDQPVPGLAAKVDDVVVGCKDPVGEPVITHELPDVFYGVELRTFRRQGNDADIVGHFQLPGHVPSGLVHQQHAVGARFDSERYFRQVQRHGLGIAERKDQASPFAEFGADGTKDIGRFRPLVLRCRRPGAAPGPATSDLVFLADAGFVLEPDLYRRAAREGGFDLCQLSCKAPFLKSSIAYSFWLWWRGRAVSLT